MSSSAPAAAHAAAAPPADARAPRRVRHQPRRRTLTVKQADEIAAHMIRITLTGDLEGFLSLGFDDHVKLFFPDGTTDAEGAPNVLSRDFTPRRHDPAANTLEIDFAIHDAGPATRWAASAKPGVYAVARRATRLIHHSDRIRLASPGRRRDRATRHRTPSRRIPGRDAGRGRGEVDGPDDEIAFTTKANATVTWAHRDGAAAGASDVLAKTLSTLKLPGGDYYAWVACKSLTAKALRRQLIADHGANPKWMRAAGYWRRGAVAVHEMHDE